jgi:hypothetical protein
MKMHVYWIGGPADGAYMLMPEENLHRVLTVITGSRLNPQKRHVTPRYEGERWILPYYEGQIVKETR